MVSAVAEHLGIGIYSPAEAALYARERTGTINRWLFGTPKNAPVVSNQLATEEKVVTFLDFIQILAIADIRKQFDVPLQTIRQAVDKAKERYRVAFPFAMRHKTYLFERAERVKKTKESKETATEEAGDEGGRRFEIVLATGSDGDGLVQLTGPKADSYMIKDVIELYLRDLTYDEDSGLAAEYCAWKEDELEITMNPHRHFGEPLTPSRYTAVALAQAVTAEGSIERAAIAYGVEPREVEMAFRYFSSLQSPPREK